MKLTSLASHLALGVVLSSIAACSSSESNDDQRLDDPAAIETDADENEDLVSLEPISGTNQNRPNGPDTLDDDDASPDEDTPEVPDEENAEDDDGDTDVEPGGDTGADNDEEAAEQENGDNTDDENGVNTVEGNGGDTDETTGEDTDETNGEDADETDGADTDETDGEDTEAGDDDGNEEEGAMLIPQVDGDSDLDRLLEGLTRQASITLLDLNRRITQGLFISPLRELCISDFDAGLGDALTAIDCAPRTLATGGINIGVERAAFYNTAVCQESLFGQSTSGCILETISFELDALFEIPARGGRPVPVFPGADIEYAIGNNDLRITNIESAVTGRFSCVLDLESNTLSAMALRAACAGIIESVADQIERLQDL